MLGNQLYPKEKFVQLNKFKQMGASELEFFVYLDGDATLSPSFKNYDWKAKKDDVKK